MLTEQVNSVQTWLKYHLPWTSQLSFLTRTWFCWFKYLIIWMLERVELPHHSYGSFPLALLGSTWLNLFFFFFRGSTWYYLCFDNITAEVPSRPLIGQSFVSGRVVSSSSSSDSDHWSVLRLLLFFLVSYVVAVWKTTLWSVSEVQTRGSKEREKRRCDPRVAVLWRPHHAEADLWSSLLWWKMT